MVRVKLEIFNTSFIVYIIDQSLNDILSIMTDELSTFSYIFNKDTKRTIRERDKTYFSHLAHIDSYRFSIQSLKDFMLLLNSRFVTREEISALYFRHYDVDKINININSDFILRDYQHTYIDAITEENAKKIILIDLSTGRGKSLIALASIAKLNMKTCILIKPKYVDKWILDLKRYTDIVDSDIYIVQGEESLQYLIDNGNSYKFVIFSTATLGNLISDYESYHSYSLSIPPYELLKHLKIGIVYNDETHEEFHRVFKILLYLNPLRVIGSSATLLTAQAEVNKMYNVLFPTSNRISNIIGLDSYVNIVAVNYKLTSGQGIRFKGPKGYSHIMYEQSIMRNNILMNGYINMINTYIKESYITKRLPGDKIVIFVSTIRMASVLCNHFAKMYKEFDVRRYVEDDPFSNLMDAEMCFTTQLSAGTAVDIPNLISVIQTVSTSSIQANMQNKGRLREIKGREVYYYYLYTTFIDKQKQYHFDRMKAIRPSSKTYSFVEYPIVLRVR